MGRHLQNIPIWVYFVTRVPPQCTWSTTINIYQNHKVGSSVRKCAFKCSRAILFIAIFSSLLFQFNIQLFYHISEKIWTKFFPEFVINGLATKVLSFKFIFACPIFIVHASMKPYIEQSPSTACLHCEDHVIRLFNR